MLTSEEMVGKIITVNGPIDPADAEILMPHEHVLTWVGPPGSLTPFFLGDPPVQTGHVKEYVDAGGKTLVALSNHGLRWDAPGAPPLPFPSYPGALQQISNDSGAHIVLGTGFYKAPWQTDETLALSISELKQIILDEIFEGVDGVNAGIIGEIGISNPGNDTTLVLFEWKSLVAGCLALLETGLSMNIHTDISTSGDVRQLVLDICERMGAPLERIFMSHLRPQLPDEREQARAIMSRGALCCFDLIGHFGFGAAEDNDAAKGIAELIGEGFLDRIVISEDIFCSQEGLFFDGNPPVGYEYMTNVFEPMLRDAGVPDDQIRQMRVDNVQRVMTVVEPLVPSIDVNLVTLTGTVRRPVVRNVPGRGGQAALSFIGGSLEAPNTPLLQPIIPFTAMAWARIPPPHRRTVCLVDSSLTPSTPDAPWPERAARGWALNAVFDAAGASGVQLSVGSGTGEIISAVGGGDLFDARWHHLAGVLDGNDVMVYVDGVQTAQVPIGAAMPVAASGGVSIGKHTAGTGLLHGFLQDVLYYSRALGPEEIADAFTAGLPPAGPPH